MHLSSMHRDFLVSETTRRAFLKIEQLKPKSRQTHTQREPVDSWADDGGRMYTDGRIRLSSLHEGVRISNDQFDFDFDNDAENDLVTTTDVDTYPINIVINDEDKDGKPIKVKRAVHCVFKYNAYQSQRITQETPRERNRTSKIINDIDKVYSDISRYNVKASTAVVQNKINSAVNQLMDLADSFNSKAVQAIELTKDAANGLANGELNPNFVRDLRSATDTSVYSKNTDEAAKSTWKSKCNSFLNGIRKTFGGTMKISARDKSLIGSLFQGDIVSRNALPKMSIIQLLRIAAQKFVNRAGKNYSAILIPASSGRFNNEFATAIQREIGPIPIIECPKNSRMSENEPAIAGKDGGVYFDRAAYREDCRNAGKTEDPDPFQGGRGAGGAQWGYNLSKYTSPPKRIKDINQDMRKYWKNLYIINSKDMNAVIYGDILIVDDSVDSNTTMVNCFEMLRGYEVRSATGCVLLNLQSSTTELAAEVETEEEPAAV